MKKALLGFVLLILSTQGIGSDNRTAEVGGEELNRARKQLKSGTIFEPKYPSGVIYGFIEGCYLAFEDAQYKSGELWPTDLKEICGCMMDGLREAVPVQEFIRDWGGNLTPEQESIANMFGMICTEQIIKERLNNTKDPV